MPVMRVFYTFYIRACLQIPFCYETRCIFPGYVTEPEIVLNLATAKPPAISEPVPCRESASGFSRRN